MQEAKVEGVNYDIAFSQMCLETGFLRYGEDVKSKQNNFLDITIAQESLLLIPKDTVICLDFLLRHWAFF